MKVILTSWWRPFLIKTSYWRRIWIIDVFLTSNIDVQFIRHIDVKSSIIWHTEVWVESYIDVISWALIDGRPINTACSRRILVKALKHVVYLLDLRHWRHRPKSDNNSTVYDLYERLYTVIFLNSMFSSQLTLRSQSSQVNVICATLERSSI